jgi:hypothetical protein
VLQYLHGDSVIDQEIQEREAPPQSSGPWRSRITGYGEESPDQLLANPFNFRVHSREQEKALGGVLETVGVVQNVIVNTTTDHVLDGHLRISLAISAGQPKVPITYVELSEEEEKLVLATLDPISAMAGRDDEIFKELTGDMGDVFKDLVAATGQAVPESSAGGKRENNGLGSPTITYTIVFDSENQQKSWFMFLRQIKTKYPDCDTAGARIARFIEDLA